MKTEDIIEQARRRLKPRYKMGKFHKMWLEAHREPSWLYRQYVLCDPLPRAGKAHIDSIKADNV